MDRKLRVCHLSSVHRAEDSRIFKKECATLSARYEVHIVAPHPYSGELGGISIHRMPSFSSRWMRIFIGGPLLFFKALRINARLYHFHDPELIPQGLILRLLGKKVIYDVHELYAEDMHEKKWLPFRNLFRRVYLFFEKLACRHFFLVLAESSYTGYYKGKTNNFEVIRNFVQPELFERIANMAEKKDRNTLLMVGALAARRGLPAIFQAIKLLKDTGVRIRLLCVGSLTRDLESLLSESEVYPEIKDQVEFAGYIPIPDAYSRTPECFAGIALPEDLPNHRESHPTKLFEYMAVGLPVICSDFPINREVIEIHQCGICVNPGNTSEVADAIRYLHNSPGLGRQMGERGKLALRENYTWSAERNKLLEVYQTLLP